jgi:hypothetical protein
MMCNIEAQQVLFNNMLVQYGGNVQTECHNVLL